MRWWILLIVGSVGLGIVPAIAEMQQESDNASAIDSARHGLQSQANFPWYDAENDELHRVEIVPQKLPPEASDWSIDPATSKPAKKRRTWNTLWKDLARILQYVAWIVLGGLLIVGIYMAIRSLLETEISLSVDRADEEADEVTEAAIMERLPFDIRRPQTDLLAEVQRQYEAGNYREAIIYLFSYQLVQLDKNHWIRLSQGKTNRQYLRELRKNGDMRSLLRGTIVVFEDVFFGHYSIDQSRFESCWKRMDEFHQLVRPEGTA